jgi:hypothetical protein
MKYLLLLLSFNVYGAEFIIEQGESTVWFANPNYYTEAKYGALALRTEGQLYLEAIQGGWRGENSSRFAGGSLGVKSSGKYFAEASLGVVRLIKPKTSQLSGRYQFLVSAGIGLIADNLIFYGKLRHFSNGGTVNNNIGFDVALIGVGVVF